jgi:hypothetical protein
MNAGSLDFRLGLESSEFVSKAGQAAVATKALTGNTINYGAATKSITASTKVLAGALGNIGFAVAPQLTGSIYGATAAVKALGLVAKTTGLSLSGLGVAGLGVAGIFGIVTSGFDAAKAKLAELASENSLSAGLDKQRDALLAFVQLQDRLGKITRKESLELQVRLTASNESIASVMRDIRQRFATQKFDLGGITDLQGFERQIQSQTLSGREKALFDLDTQATDMLNKLSELSQKAGLGVVNQSDLVDKFSQARLREIEQEFGPKTQPPTVAPGIRDTTSIEKMGFVFNGRGSSNDYARSTADNTKKLVEIGKQTLDAIKTKTDSGFNNLA